MDLNEQLLAVAREAQARIDDALARLTSSDFEGSRFDQAGLYDGSAIATDFIRAGEIGLAIEHVLYMVTETGISLSSSSALVLERTAATFGVQAPRIPVAP